MNSTCNTRDETMLTHWKGWSLSPQTQSSYSLEEESADTETDAERMYNHLQTPGYYRWCNDKHTKYKKTSDFFYFSTSALFFFNFAQPKNISSFNFCFSI